MSVDVSIYAKTASGCPDWVARVYGEGPATKAGIHERDANARLIAAAPELLAALGECAAVLEELGADGELGDMPAPVLDNARATLAKAKGEA